MTRAPYILLVCAILAPLPGTSTFLEAAEIPDDWIIDNVRRSEPTGGAELIELRNLHGDLRVRPADEEEISLSAMIQRHADDPCHPEIRTCRRGIDVLRIEVLYPEAEGRTRSLARVWSKRRVDMTLFVPAKAPAHPRNGRGLIDVKGLDRGVSARSQNGDIVLSTAGPVTAFTERGSITARFSATDWDSAVQARDPDRCHHRDLAANRRCHGHHDDLRRAHHRLFADRRSAAREGAQDRTSDNG